MIPVPQPELLGGKRSDLVSDFCVVEWKGYQQRRITVEARLLIMPQKKTPLSRF